MRQKNVMVKLVTGCIIAGMILSFILPSTATVVLARQREELNSSWSSIEEPIVIDSLFDFEIAEESHSLSEEEILFLLETQEKLLAQVEEHPLRMPRAFSWSRVGQNLIGLWNRSHSFRAAMKTVGLGWTQISAIARGVYVYSYSVLGAKIATVAAWNWAIAVVIGTSAGVAIAVMGNYRLFY